MKGLNDKNKQFCEEYVKNSYKGGTAYGIVYEQKDKQTCASAAYKLLRDPRILEEINNVECNFRIAGFNAGIDKSSIMKVLADMLLANKKEGEPDYMARNNAINTWAKLTGDFVEKKKIEIEDNRELDGIDPTKLSDEESQELEKRLLNNL